MVDLLQGCYSAMDGHRVRRTSVRHEYAGSVQWISLANINAVGTLKSAGAGGIGIEEMAV